jgi:hypothetical protein
VRGREVGRGGEESPVKKREETRRRAPREEERGERRDAERKSEGYTPAWGGRCRRVLVRLL